MRHSVSRFLPLLFGIVFISVDGHLLWCPSFTLPSLMPRQVKSSSCPSDPRFSRVMGRPNLNESRRNLYWRMTKRTINRAWSSMVLFWWQSVLLRRQWWCRSIPFWKTTAWHRLTAVQLLASDLPTPKKHLTPVVFLQILATCCNHLRGWILKSGEPQLPTYLPCQLLVGTLILFNIIQPTERMFLQSSVID